MAISPEQNDPVKSDLSETQEKATLLKKRVSEAIAIPLRPAVERCGGFCQQYPHSPALGFAEPGGSRSLPRRPAPSGWA